MQQCSRVVLYGNSTKTQEREEVLGLRRREEEKDQENKRIEPRILPYQTTAKSMQVPFVARGLKTLTFIDSLSFFYF